MRIGIDCDGVLRDFIGNLTDHIKENYPDNSNKILIPTSWDWEQWLPFWTSDETEKYVFKDNYIDLFGIDCPPIQSSFEDWQKIRGWAIENGHELILVSAQRPHCVEPTKEWLFNWGFIGWDEMHFTNKKHLIDVDVLVDDSPAKLFTFKKKSVNNGSPICMSQTWNKECHTKMMTIDKLSDIIGKIFD